MINSTIYTFEIATGFINIKQTHTFDMARKASYPPRFPPNEDWRLAQDETLRRVGSIFGPYTSGLPYAAAMKMSKYEEQVTSCLKVLLGSSGVDKSLLREVVVPIRVDDKLRRFLDGLDSELSPDFLRRDYVEVRFDFVWWDGQRLNIVEVDGTQHGRRVDSFFHQQQGMYEKTMRRDALKNALVMILAPQVRMLRVPPKFEGCSRRADVFSSMQAYVAQWFLQEVNRQPAVFSEESEHGLIQMYVTRLLLLLQPDRSGAWAVRNHRQRVSRSAPREVRPERRSDEEFKAYTRANREAKERVQSDTSMPSDRRQRALEVIKRRQAGVNTKKRPRDDSGQPYLLRWWREVRS